VHGMNNELLFPALSTMIALMVYYSQGIFVSLARRKHGIAAPKTTGNEAFENVFRVHYNTLENLPIFLTSLWFFADQAIAQEDKHHPARKQS
jgi:glutathione S-transferase